MTGVTAIMAGISNSLPQVLITNRSVRDTVTSPTPASAVYTLQSTGDVVVSDFGTVEQWITPQVGMSGYEARVTVTSGTLSTGTAGTWLNLGTNRSWSVNRSTVGVSIAAITVEIRPTGGITVTSANITLNADVR